MAMIRLSLTDCFSVANNVEGRPSEGGDCQGPAEGCHGTLEGDTQKKPSRRLQGSFLLKESNAASLNWMAPQRLLPVHSRRAPYSMVNSCPGEQFTQHFLQKTSDSDVS